MATPSVVDDLDRVVADLLDALRTRLDADWSVPAPALGWTCHHTLDHVAESLFFYAGQVVPVAPWLGDGYPYATAEVHPGGPEGALFTRPDAGNVGTARALARCAGLLGAAARACDPTWRAAHMWGASDADGFTSMAIVEVVVHHHDVAAPLGLLWHPPADVCTRVLRRLFPHVPDDDDVDPAATLLEATGRRARPGQDPLVDWRWYGEVR